MSSQTFKPDTIEKAAAALLAQIEADGITQGIGDAIGFKPGFVGAIARLRDALNTPAQLGDGSHAAAAWQWRAVISGKPTSWLQMDEAVAKFRNRYAEELALGVYELRPLYAHPPQVEGSDDEHAGMAWWNSLDEKQRPVWMARAGNTGIAADAWAAFKAAAASPPTGDEWQPIATAPVEPWDDNQPSYYRFNCLLQDDRGWVFGGFAEYTHVKKQLTWKSDRGEAVKPVLWQPLPSARSQEATEKKS